MSSTQAPAKRVAVVGAGVAGLGAAVRLAEAGFTVTVYDPAPTVGGQAGGFEIGGTSLERFYHYLLQSDHRALQWIDEVGLTDKVRFIPTTMGFFTNGRLYPFGTAASLMTFTPLPFWDRIRLGLRLRALGRTPSPDPFENITAVEWLERHASVAELEVFWIPLLRAKWGPAFDRIGMWWLWVRFRVRVGRSLGARERLGYLMGGFQQFADALEAKARGLGVEFVLGCGLTSVEVAEGQVVAVTGGDGERRAAAGVVWTASLNALAEAAPALSDDYRRRCRSVEYHHAIVVLVELAEPTLPYCWNNIADPTLPLTVVVEHTRLVDPAHYGGRTIVYLGRYAGPDEPITRASNDEIRDKFLAAAAEHLSPNFRNPLATHVFRTPAGQPVVPPGWNEKRPALRTGIRGLVAANNAQLYPWDRGINYSIGLGEEAASAINEDIG